MRQAPPGRLSPRGFHVPFLQLVSAVLLLAVLFPLPTRAETTEERKAVARRVFDEIFNQGRFEVAAQIYAPDFVNHGLQRDFGLKEDQEAARGWKAAAPDLHMELRKILADGEYVTVLWYAEGTNTGAGNGLPATGKKMRGSGITIWRIADGRIREEWSQFDASGLLVQLGLLVPAPPPGPR
jgi:steroid delta-isomerase-like uncharacterized protein